MFADGDYEKAAEFYREALRNDSSCTEALYNIGKCGAGIPERGPRQAAEQTLGLCSRLTALMVPKLHAWQMGTGAALVPRGHFRSVPTGERLAGPLSRLPLVLDVAVHLLPN